MQHEAHCLEFYFILRTTLEMCVRWRGFEGSRTKSGLCLESLGVTEEGTDVKCSAIVHLAVVCRMRSRRLRQGGH